jgi:hypothetical protein
MRKKEPQMNGRLRRKAKGKNELPAVISLSLSMRDVSVTFAFWFLPFAFCLAAQPPWFLLFPD